MERAGAPMQVSMTSTALVPAPVARLNRGGTRVRTHRVGSVAALVLSRRAALLAWAGPISAQPIAVFVAASAPIGGSDLFTSGDDRRSTSRRRSDTSAVDPIDPPSSLL